MSRAPACQAGLVLADSFWQAPLAPAAVALTAGIVTDRWFSVPLAYSLLLGSSGLLAWLIVFSTSPKPRESLLYLTLAGVALGAAYHHAWQHVFPQDDLLQRVQLTGNAQRVTLRGYLDDEPVVMPPPRDRSLYAIPQEPGSTAALQARQLLREHGWEEVSGCVVVFIEGTAEDLHLQDQVELTGLLMPIPGPANPGERDFRQVAADARIRARLQVTKRAGSFQRIERGWAGSFSLWLARVRRWGEDVFRQVFPDETIRGLADALILGDGAPLGREGWRPYQRTGVIHVLVISGQHLVLLATALLWVLRRLGFRQRQSAVLVAVFLLLYVGLTGFRPPSTRSAVTMCLLFAGWVLARRIVPANALALAWIVVIAVNPTSIFEPGCQLSFLCILVLHRIGMLWEAPQPPTLDNQDPKGLQRLIDQTRPVWLRFLRRQFFDAGSAYVVGLWMWLAVTPLVAYQYGVVPAVALLIGPPVVLLTTIALGFGFLLLLLDALQIPGWGGAAYPVQWSLSGCEWLVQWGDRSPGWVFVPALPSWGVVVFYVGLLTWLTLRSLARQWRWACLAAGGWFCVGLLAPLLRFPADELRCTFLAVGHGSCTVLETPEGRTILYDAGSLPGPRVLRNQIAPFLQHRGIRRIDDLILSHSDLDHFNGLPDLLQEFAIGRVILTPSFSEKSAPGVAAVLKHLEEQRIPIEIVKQGDLILAGDSVTMEVLHPPEVGPLGKENVRSLTLLVRHAGHSILLTGDLEAEGLSQLLRKPPQKIDVLMAPHHGSKRLDTAGLVDWAGNPWTVISSQGRPRGSPDRPKGYDKAEHFLRTWDQGSVTVRSHSTGLVVERFLSGELLTKPSSPPRKRK